MSSLESTLAKHLKLQAKIQAGGGGENRSLIDPANWTSSDRGSSPTTLAAETNKILNGAYQAPVDDDDDASAKVLSRQPVVTFANVSGRPTPPRRDVEASATVPKTPASMNRTSAHRAPPSAHRTPAVVHRTPAVAHRTPGIMKQTNNKTKFGKLARIASSDIEEFDEDAVKVILGKRSPDAPAEPASVQPSPPQRPVKRLRTSTRATRSESKQSEGPSTKNPDGAAKTRSRRKRQT